MNRYFCVCCFATDQDGSGGDVTDGLGNYCYNCGSGGSTVLLPEWAVKLIREHASWVGKRYYPNSEDLERREERDRLLKLMDHFPGRTAVKQLVDGSQVWVVTQNKPGGGTITTWIRGDHTELEALRLSGLTYYAAEDFRSPAAL